MNDIDRNRIDIVVKLDDLGVGLCGNIDDIINQLSKIKKKYQNLGYQTVDIVLEEYGYNDGWEFLIHGYRKENDDEYSSRIAMLEEEAREKEEEANEKKRLKAELRREVRERELRHLETLAKKYGKTVE